MFLSRALAQEFLERGHHVTCLARTAPTNLPEGARAVCADRNRGTDAYDDVRTQWDAVLDVATDPLRVREALRVLGGRARHWTYVSSCSVYADQNEPDADESHEILAPLIETEVSSLENYGASKSASESACRLILGDRLLVVRPGLIVGPGDPSDRGGYWPARFARSAGSVLVPAARGLRAQMIDVADLARWLVQCVETRLTGTMNAVGESYPWDHVIDAACGVTGESPPRVVVEDEWLTAQGVQPWAGDRSLPLWIPRGQGFDGFARRSGSLARRYGLSLTPLEMTFAGVLAFEKRAGLDRDRRAGLHLTDETLLIKQWAER